MWFAIIAFLGWWIIFEYLGYVPREGFFSGRWIPEPVPQSPHGNSDLPEYDTGILRANRYYNGRTNDTNLFSLNSEIPTTYMINILKTVKETDSSFTVPPGASTITSWLATTQQDLSQLKPRDLAEIKELADLFGIFRMYLVTKINMASLAGGYSSPSHPFQPFRIIRSMNTKLEPGYKAVVDMTVWRSYKTHSFNIQATIDFQVAGDSLACQITELEVVGSTIEDQSLPGAQDMPSSAPVADRTDGIANMAIGDYSAGSVGLEKLMAEYKPPVDTCNSDSPAAQNFRYRLYENARASQPANLRQPVLQNNAWTNTDPAIEEKVRRYLTTGCGRCYGVDPATNEIVELFQYSDNKVACESAHAELAGAVGVWDTPCIEDTDCPYYRANRNYPNTFGKCIKSVGTCEMPVGAIRMGYKREHKASQPRCNNCERLPGYQVAVESDEACCDLQRNSLGPLGMTTPDYRFAGDFVERNKNAGVLQAMGLKP